MRIIAAYMMAVLGGNDAPDAEAITKILDSVGITADKAQLDKVVAALEGKDLDELIKSGLEQLADNIGGGGGGGGGGGAGAAGGADAAAAEPEPEEEEEEAPAMDMFGGGDDEEEGDY